jgi:hypothetical protein
MFLILAIFLPNLTAKIAVNKKQKPATKSQEEIKKLKWFCLSETRQMLRDFLLVDILQPNWQKK